MKTFALFSLAAVLTAPLYAQNYNLVTGQAKRAAGSEAPPANAKPGGSPSAPQQPPVDPAVAATLQNIKNLSANLTTISASPDATKAGEERLSLLNNLSSAAKGKKASAASVKKLAQDLINGLAAKKVSAADQQKLSRAIYALFNAAHLTDAQQEAVLGDTKKILTAAAVPEADTATLVEDLKAIAAETK